PLTKKAAFGSKLSFQPADQGCFHAYDEDRDERACLRHGAVGGLRNGRSVRHLLAEDSSTAEYRISAAGTRARCQSNGARGRRYAVYRPSNRRGGFATPPGCGARIQRLRESDGRRADEPRAAAHHSARDDPAW